MDEESKVAQGIRAELLSLADILAKMAERKDMHYICVKHPQTRPQTLVGEAQIFEVELPARTCALVPATLLSLTDRIARLEKMVAQEAH